MLGRIAKLSAAIALPGPTAEINPGGMVAGRDSDTDSGPGGSLRRLDRRTLRHGIPAWPGRLYY